MSLRFTFRGSEQIRRHLFFYSDSNDFARYETLKNRLALYRLVFGQPRQQDLLDRIRRSVHNAGESASQKLTRYMINLSPMCEERIKEFAVKEAHRLTGSPTDLRQLLVDVELVMARRRSELATVMDELVYLRGLVDQHLNYSSVADEFLIEAVQALAYLRNPYDAIFDEHEGLGLTDDCAVILQSCNRIRSWSTGVTGTSKAKAAEQT